MSDGFGTFLTFFGVATLGVGALAWLAGYLSNRLSTRRPHVRGRKPGEPLDTAATRILAEMKAEREANERARSTGRVCFKVLRDIHGKDPDFLPMMRELGFDFDPRGEDPTLVHFEGAWFDVEPDEKPE